MNRIEDPWEFEHSETRHQAHQRHWVETIQDYDPDFRPPLQTVVCPQCGGRGSSSLYLGSFTQEQMAEDPDFAEDYMRGGYDRTCETCHGQNVVHQLDYENLTPEMKHSYEEWMNDAYESDAIQRMERMMGA